MKWKTENQQRKLTKLKAVSEKKINKINQVLTRLAKKKEIEHKLLLSEMKEKTELQNPGKLKR